MPPPSVSFSGPGSGELPFNPTLGEPGPGAEQPTAGPSSDEVAANWLKGLRASLGAGLPEGELGWFPFPTIPSGAGTPTDVLGGGDGFAVGKNAPDAAIDFLRYLTSPEVQERYVALNVGFIPTVVGAEDSVSDPFPQQIMEACNSAEYYQLYYDQFLPPTVAQAVLDAVEALFVGTLSAEDAAQSIEDIASFELR